MELFLITNCVFSADFSEEHIEPLKDVSEKLTVVSEKLGKNVYYLKKYSNHVVQPIMLAQNYADYVNKTVQSKTI